MKKIILGVLGLFLFLSVYGEEESFDLGNKTLEGSDKRVFQTEIELLEFQEKELIDEDVNLSISEEDLNSLEEIKFDDIEIDEMISDDELKYNIILKQPEVLIKKNQVLSNDKNVLVLGAGAFDNLNSFYYLLDFNKSEEDFSYAITLNRDIRGEDRDNSDVYLDKMSAKIWAGKYYLKLDHNILNEKLPGVGTASSPVTSYKDKNNTELTFQYDAYQKDNSNLKISADITTEFLKSPGTEQRNYDIRSYQLGLDYKTEHILENVNQNLNFKLSAEQETFMDESSNDIKLSLDDSIIWNKIKSTEFNVNLGLQSYQGDIKSESNVYFKGKATRVMTPNMNILLSLEYDSFAKSNKEILNESKYDTDVLPASYDATGIVVETLNELESEKETILELAAEYNLDKIYINPKIRYVSSDDKLIYVQDSDFFIKDEIPLEVDNYEGSLSWVELELYGTYFYTEEYRADFRYIYSSLDKVSFNPNSELKVNLIYENKSYKADLEIVNRSKMYGGINKTSELDNDFSLNVYNSFKINNSINASVNFLNLFDKESEKKTGYLTDSRKLELKVKILF